MKNQELSFKGLGTALSKSAMKSIVAGLGGVDCSKLGEACTGGVQCCSNHCGTCKTTDIGYGVTGNCCVSGDPEE